MVGDRQPDLVLLDVEMPVQTGPEMALDMFVHDCGLEQIPVLLLSGVLDLRRIAAAVGTPYFLRKPYDMQPLLRLLGKALVERVPPHPTLQHRPHA